ncbi:hypothetical protein [Halopseudomonas bauzanensis]|uniref:hypothetical protein n=1 Tax=Halopseudomonas bauzanensis TaxID=653930 RepID=UPI00255714BF|nr:hypothetical protein [Halopseudomonas bauzanensis]
MMISVASITAQGLPGAGVGHRSAAHRAATLLPLHFTSFTAVNDETVPAGVRHAERI